jgi:hypothetical protein
MQNFGRNPEGKDHSEDVGVGGKIISEWILEKRWVSVDWMHLIQDRDGWRAVVSTVMNLRVL